MEPRKLKGNIEILIEELDKENKVKDIPADVWDAVMASMEKDLDDYQAKEQVRMKKSEDELFRVVLNA